MWCFINWSFLESIWIVFLMFWRCGIEIFDWVNERLLFNFGVEIFGLCCFRGFLWWIWCDGCEILDVLVESDYELKCFGDIFEFVLWIEYLIVFLMFLNEVVDWCLICRRNEVYFEIVLLLISLFDGNVLMWL